jgi:hypothetical protein
MEPNVQEREARDAYHFFIYFHPTTTRRHFLQKRRRAQKNREGCEQTGFLLQFDEKAHDADEKIDNEINSALCRFGVFNKFD